MHGRALKTHWLWVLQTLPEVKVVGNASVYPKLTGGKTKYVRTRTKFKEIEHLTQFYHILGIKMRQNLQKALHDRKQGVRKHGCASAHKEEAPWAFSKAPLRGAIPVGLFGAGKYHPTTSRALWDEATHLWGRSPSARCGSFSQWSSRSTSRALGQHHKTVRGGQFPSDRFLPRRGLV